MLRKVAKYATICKRFRQQEIGNRSEQTAIISQTFHHSHETTIVLVLRALCIDFKNQVA